MRCLLLRRQTPSPSAVKRIQPGQRSHQRRSQRLQLIPRRLSPRHSPTAIQSRKASVLRTPTCLNLSHETPILLIPSTSSGDSSIFQLFSLKIFQPWISAAALPACYPVQMLGESPLGLVALVYSHAAQRSAGSVASGYVLLRPDAS